MYLWPAIECSKPCNGSASWNHGYCGLCAKGYNSKQRKCCRAAFHLHDKWECHDCMRWVDKCSPSCVWDKGVRIIIFMFVTHSKLKLQITEVMPLDMCHLTWLYNNKCVLMAPYIQHKHIHVKSPPSVRLYKKWFPTSLSPDAIITHAGGIDLCAKFPRLASRATLLPWSQRETCFYQCKTPSMYASISCRRECTK